jgi:hypothetical protein
MFEWYRKYKKDKVQKKMIKRLDTLVGPRLQAHMELYSRMYRGMIKARLPGMIYQDDDLKIRHMWTQKRGHLDIYDIYYRDYPKFSYDLHEYFDDALIDMCKIIVQYKEMPTEQWEVK